VPTAEDIRLLVSYPWPGNVRELAAVIERAAILGGGQSLEVAQALGTAPARPPQPVPGISAQVPTIIEDEAGKGASWLTLDTAQNPLGSSGQPIHKGPSPAVASEPLCEQSWREYGGNGFRGAAGKAASDGRA
jgi:DNA-binding NtrC family response regulator